MTDKDLKVYVGEDRLPVHDLTEYVDWPDSRFISQAYNGESSVSSIVFRDENSEFGPWSDSPITIAARNEIEVKHGSNFLFRGRAIGRTWERGAQKAFKAREVVAEAEDVNVELRGIRVDQWVRPAETDRARVLALREDYLDGLVRTGANLSTTYVSASNTQTLPEKTYKQTNPLGVLQDIAFQTDKQFFVTIDKELWYDGWDSTAYACPFRITDDPAELKANPTTTLAIVPDVGALFAINGQQFISDVRVYYGSADDQYVDASDPGIESVKAHWADTVYAPEVVTTASEATDYANTLLAERSQDGRTFTLSVSHASGGPLTEAQIGSIKPGMLISIKARVLPFFIAGTLQPNYSYYHTRIVSLQWHMPLPGQYFATLKLERPEKTYGIGTKPPPRPAGSGTPDLVGCAFSDSGATITLQIENGLTNSMLVAVGFGADALTGRTPGEPAVYTPSSGPAQTMTTVPGSLILNAGNQWGLRMYYLLNPTASPSGSGTGSIFIPKVDFPTEGTWGGWWLLQNVNPDAPLGTAATNSGTGTTSSLSITGTGLFLNAVANSAGSGVTEPTVGAGQILCGANSAFGTIAAGNGYGDSTPSWTLSSSSPWVSVGVAVNATGSTTQPTGDSSDPGTDTGEFSNPDHVHAHGTHTADYHTNYVQEADANWVDLTDGGATTLHSHAGGGMTNPMTSVGDVIKGGAAGAAERLAIGGSNFLFKSTGTTPEWANTARLSFLDVDEHTPPNPPSPPASVIRIYGSNSKGYYKNSGGTVVELGGAGGGGGTTLTIEEVDGTPTVSATKLVLPNGTVSVVGTVATYTPAGGGGSGLAESYERSDAAAGPASPSAQDDEFEDAAISGSWTRVNSGTTYGSFAENYSRLSWHQTASFGANGLDVYMQARTISIGDYVEIGARAVLVAGSTVGIGLGFSDGTTYGTSEAVSLFWHASGATNRFMLNAWPNLNSRSTDGTIIDRESLGNRWYVRVKYEAANTWGLYISPNGHQWHTVQSNFAFTMTPTHVLFGAAAITNAATAPNWHLFDYIRVNAA